ncbi:MAG: hypothetical protein ABI947_07330 [Chloroflexota bacterium]
MKLDQQSMPSTPIYSRLALPAIAAMCLLFAMLACTSNDTLFIHLTATPVPTPVPTPLSIETRFKKGQLVYAVSNRRVIQLNDAPGQKNFSTTGVLTSCFRNTQVTVLDVGKNSDDPEDPIIYYQVDCGSSGQGWLPEYGLTQFLPTGGTAVIKSPDGKGAPMYKNPSVKSPPVGDQPCADGATVKISDITRNIDLSSKIEDTTLFAKVNCSGVTGFLMESFLAPANP